MKKLVMILIVLGLVSFANATLVGGFNGSLDGWTPYMGTAQTVSTLTLEGSPLSPTEGSQFLSCGPMTGISGIVLDAGMINAGDWLSFDYAAVSYSYPSYPARPSGVEWQVSRTGDEDVVLPYLKGNMINTRGQWAHISVDLSTLAGSNNTIYFAGGASFALDNVQLGAIPEPATMLLLGLGAVLLRKKK